MRIDQQIETLLKQDKVTVSQVAGDWALWIDMLRQGAEPETAAAIRKLKNRIYAGKGIEGLERDGIHQAKILNLMDNAVDALDMGDNATALNTLEEYYPTFAEVLSFAAMMSKGRVGAMKVRPPVRKQVFDYNALKDYLEAEVDPGDYQTAEEIAVNFNVMGVEPYVTERMVLIAAERLQDDGYVTVEGKEIYLLPDELRPYPGMPYSDSIEPKW